MNQNLPHVWSTEADKPTYMSVAKTNQQKVLYIYLSSLEDPALTKARLSAWLLCNHEKNHQYTPVLKKSIQCTKYVVNAEV